MDKIGRQTGRILCPRSHVISVPGRQNEQTRKLACAIRIGRQIVNSSGPRRWSPPITIIGRGYSRAENPFSVREGNFRPGNAFTEQLRVQRGGPGISTARRKQTHRLQPVSDILRLGRIDCLSQIAECSKTGHSGSVISRIISQSSRINGMQVFLCHQRRQQRMTAVDAGIEQTYARRVVAVVRKARSSQQVVLPLALLVNAHCVKEIGSLLSSSQFSDTIQSQDRA